MALSDPGYVNDFETLISFNVALALRVAGYYANNQHEELQSIVMEKERIVLLISVPVALFIVLLGPW